MEACEPDTFTGTQDGQGRQEQITRGLCGPRRLPMGFILIALGRRELTHCRAWMGPGCGLTHT